MPVQFRAKAASTSEGLDGAAWTDYESLEAGEENAVNNLADSYRHLRLEVKLTRGSEPEINSVSQNYGSGC